MQTYSVVLQLLAIFIINLPSFENLLSFLVYSVFICSLKKRLYKAILRFFKCHANTLPWLNQSSHNQVNRPRELL